MQVNNQQPPAKADYNKDGKVDQKDKKIEEDLQKLGELAKKLDELQSGGTKGSGGGGGGDKDEMKVIKELMNQIKKDLEENGYKSEKG